MMSAWTVTLRGSPDLPWIRHVQGVVRPSFPWGTSRQIRVPWNPNSPSLVTYAALQIRDTTTTSHHGAVALSRPAQKCVPEKPTQCPSHCAPTLLTTTWPQGKYRRPHGYGRNASGCADNASPYSRKVVADAGQILVGRSAPRRGHGFLSFNGQCNQLLQFSDQVLLCLRTALVSGLE